MKLIKEGIAKEIPAHLVAEYKAKGWREILPAVKQPAKEPEKEPEQIQEKPKRSKKEA